MLSDGFVPTAHSSMPVAVLALVAGPLLTALAPVSALCASLDVRAPVTLAPRSVARLILVVLAPAACAVPVAFAGTVALALAAVARAPDGPIVLILVASTLRLVAPSLRLDACASLIALAPDQAVSMLLVAPDLFMLVPAVCGLGLSSVFVSIGAVDETDGNVTGRAVGG